MEHAYIIIIKNNNRYVLQEFKEIFKYTCGLNCGSPSMLEQIVHVIITGIHTLNINSFKCRLVSKGVYTNSQQ